MPKIVTVEQMRAIEAAADAAGVSYAQMMDTAGRAVADRVRQLIDGLQVETPRIAVLVGKGNNGGDGLVAARLLAAETPALINVFLAQPREESDPVLAAAREAGFLIADGAIDAEQGYRVLRTMVANADVVIDALLGTGAQLPIKGDLEKVLRQVRQALRTRRTEHQRPSFETLTMPEMSSARDPIVVSVDLPTGLDADSGALDPNAIRANETITFEAIKPGLITFPGAEAVGLLHVASLNLPEKLEALAAIGHTVVDASTVQALLPERPLDSNKGTFGKALIVAGSVNYAGAALLSAKSAYRIGAGLVTVAAPQPIVPTLAAGLSEATWLLLPHDMGVLSRNAARVLSEELARKKPSAMLIGPGLGQETPTAEFIDALFRPEAARAKARGIGFASAPASASESADPAAPIFPPLVVDADGLNLLAKIDRWWTRLPPRTVITPHPGEMARLVGFSDEGEQTAVHKVQADRIGLAVAKAAEWNVIVVLKGAFTVIAEPGGKVAVLPFANSGLAHAGTGDVLAGAIVGLLAQGLDPFDAAVAGSYIHGYAGELATVYAYHPASVLAGDVIDRIGHALQAITSA